MLMQSTGQGQAEFTAGAFIRQYGMHLFGRPQNGINRTGLDAQGTADTGAFINQGHGLGFAGRGIGGKWQIVHLQQCGQFVDAFLAARWATVDAVFPLARASA
jgi:hypothetical protein